MSISRFVNDSGRPFFHTSGYADVAHGKNLGSASKETFTERHQLDRNRTSVRRYRDSMVAGGPGQQERESQVDRSYGRNRLQVGPRSNSASGIPLIARQSFVEPPARKYNPYG